MILKGLNLPENESNDFLLTLQQVDYNEALMMISDFTQQVVARRELEQDLY